MLKVIRNDDLAVRGLRKNIRLSRIQAMAIACGMVASDGAIHYCYATYVTPSRANIDESI
jgi:ABC-type branched-subunit amino acid transport system permease subunit